MSNENDDISNDWTGKFFNKRYILIKKIGFGSYASVWMGFDIQQNNYCAIKIHNKIDFKTGKKEENSYKLIDKYNCQQLLSLRDSFVYDNNYFCCVTELLGNSLYDLIKEHVKLPFNFIIDVTKQILTALNVLHTNKIIHGDIKPENILLTKLSVDIKKTIQKVDTLIKQRNSNKKSSKLKEKIRDLFEESNDIESVNSDSDSEKSEIININSDSDSELSCNSDKDDCEIIKIKPCNIKLIDVGFCVDMENDSCEKNIQTCYYQSPEILLKLKYNEKCDLWALGCTIYELLTGCILFDADDYNGNENRYQLYIITQKLGIIPKKMIEISKYKQIIFTHDCKKIKGFNSIDFSNNLNHELNDILKIYDLDEKKQIHFMNLVLSLLEIDPDKRISAKTALQSSLFK
jgi:serine/threonine protein kinase